LENKLDNIKWLANNGNMFFRRKITEMYSKRRHIINMEIVFFFSSCLVPELLYSKRRQNKYGDSILLQQLPNKYFKRRQRINIEIVSFSAAAKEDEYCIARG
jgi:hypothetical protein